MYYISPHCAVTSPDLTWRDVQHLIAATASKTGLLGANWITNGAGLQGQVSSLNVCRCLC